jgi:putative oxidoreductase
MDFLNKLAPNAHWLLRLSLAATFLYHGIAKFPIMASMGLPVAVVWAVALAEIVAGACLIAGALTDEKLTRLGGLIVVVIMIGAIFMVHLSKGFNVMNGGMEFQLLMLATGVYFATKGNNV